MRQATGILAGLLLAACGGGGDDFEEFDPDEVGSRGYQIVSQILPEPIEKIDLLFMIDRSGSMIEEQQSLAQWAPTALFDVLADFGGDLPDLHVGVMTSDIAKPADSLCFEVDDQGDLINDNGLPGCTPPSDRWISDFDDGAGGRTTNYTGTLGDTFACMIEVGTDGCGLEEPLQALKEGLENPANAGFLREDALLAVIFISDEDDCSADPALFVPPEDGDDPLGPLSSYRCYQQGLICDQGLDTTGPKTNCYPDESSAYLDDLSTYADFLQGLKGDPTKVIVGAITGPAEPFTVIDGGSPGGPFDTSLFFDPSCESTNGVAYPAVRFNAFLDFFPARNRWTSICGADLSSALTLEANLIGGTATQSPCVYGEPGDEDAETTGLQPDCAVWAIEDYGQPGQSHTQIGPCQSANDDDCFRLVPDQANCAATETNLAVEVVSSNDDYDGQHITVACKP